MDQRLGDLLGVHRRFAAYPRRMTELDAIVAELRELVARRRVAECPEGKVFPDEVTDPTCYVHPQAGLGVGLIAIAVMLAALLVLATVLVNARADVPTDEQT